MLGKKIDTRYGQAFYHWACQGGVMSSVREDVAWLLALYKSLDSFRRLLQNPCYKPKQKVAVLTSALARYLHPVTLTFMTFLVMKRREGALAGILEEVTLFDRVDRHIRTVYLTTARRVSSAVQRDIICHVKKIMTHEGEVRLVVREDSSLVGGYVFRVHDQQLDMSIRTQLMRLERHWEKFPLSKL